MADSVRSTGSIDAARSMRVKRVADAVRLGLRVFDYAVLGVMGMLVLYGMSWAIDVGISDDPNWIMGALIVLAPQIAVFGTVFAALVTSPSSHDAELLTLVFIVIVAAITGTAHIYLFWARGPVWLARLCLLAFVLSLPGGAALYRYLESRA